MIDWDRKIAGEGLSFDDILLIPAESEVLPKETDVRTQPHQQDQLSTSPCSRRPWTPSPRRRSPSPWPGRAASPSSTRTSRSTGRRRWCAR